VQRAVNRIQSEEQTLRVIADCRSSGFRSVNVDLIYGLPEQTLQGLSRTLDVLLEARPDRLAVYGYAHLPQLFKGQRQIDAQSLPSADAKLQLLGLAISRLTAAGYQYIGMDHFALPEDELAKAREDGSLTRNFMGYSTHGDTDLLGFGVSAISQIADCISQNARDLPEWESLLEAGRLPVKRGIRLDRDDLIRAETIRSLMCHGEIDVQLLEQRHGISFVEYFKSSLAELKPLVADELVEMGAETIRVTSRGRLLLRIVAACFDKYLARDADKGAPVRYSRVV
jgi:oxygen-independent coproporphyrinogen-3 oxidase